MKFKWTFEEALDAYDAIFGDGCSLMFDEEERGDLFEEMRQVVEAVNIEEAAKPIWWWHEDDEIAIQNAIDIRRYHATGSLDALETPEEDPTVTVSEQKLCYVLRNGCVPGSEAVDQCDEGADEETCAQCMFKYLTGREYDVLA